MPPWASWRATMALCSLPRSNPGNRKEYKRVNGPFTLYMVAGGGNKLPYGNLPRLILAWVSTEAVRTQSRELVLGKSLSKFMRTLGIYNSGGNPQARLRNQMRRLFHCTVSLIYEDESGAASASSLVADRTEFWWNERKPDEPSLWESKIRLGEDFFNEIINHPVSLDMNTLTALKRCSLGLGSLPVAGLPHLRAPRSVAAHLAQVGRDLIRNGDSMHVIRIDRAGMVQLIPASSWHWEGNHDPDSWTVRVTAYGPSTSTTWNLPASGVVFVRWGGTPGQPYVGTGPLTWAHTTARLQSETERSLADEAQGPLAQLLAIPQDGGDDDGNDPLARLKADIRTARGKALLVETSSAGWGEGRTAAPQRDWQASRPGPMPPESMATIRKDSFEAVLAACGTPPSLFVDSDGTSQREALRRWHLGTVLPLARLLEHELTAKLETPVELKFDTYALDMVSRATVVAKLAQAGVPMATALEAVGLADG